jgi:hypothetical protein
MEGKNSMKQEKTIQILSLLNELDIVTRIEIIERIGKRLRQANSIQTAKEVQRFITKGQQIKRSNEG